ncbi:hypothetical protein DVH24_034219 [Malus domestica]|uniref:Uncharacterized protein n=1 Tax=Malus domestica TaxID=3750 RepID=A0A498I9W5_MALDO|nr:hypothetical protein DVH24_034219 [Malus domestica]
MASMLRPSQVEVCQLVTSQPEPPPYPGLDSAVARYCPFWAPTTPSRFCLWELTRELPSGSPIALA